MLYIKIKNGEVIISGEIVEIFDKLNAGFALSEEEIWKYRQYKKQRESLLGEGGL